MMFCGEGMVAFRNGLAEALKVRGGGSVVEWAENNVEVVQGPKQGPFRVSRTPYLREPLERFGNKATRHLVMCQGTQSGKSSGIIVGMLYKVAEDPQDALWVLPNGDMAKSFSKTRWQRYALRCEGVLDIVPKTPTGKVDKRLFGLTEQVFDTMTINFVGSNSPTDLASRPAGILAMDETDKFADESKFEAGALELAEERTKSYDFPFVVKTSTPTLEDRMIWKEFLMTDMRYYHIKCPVCGEHIPLKFRVQTEEHGECGLRWWSNDPSESKNGDVWDFEKVRMNAHYKCQKCGGKIYDDQRYSLLQSGIWIPSNPHAEEGRHGYHLNSMYSVLSGETSLGNVAVKFLQAKKARSSLRNFVNSWLAEPWSDEYFYEGKEIHREEITVHSIPNSGTTKIMAVDVQDIGYWYLVREFSPPSKDKPNGESWLIDAGYVDTESAIKDLQAGYSIDGANVLLDMRDKPNQVGRIILENDWRGVMGSDQKVFRWKRSGDIVERLYSQVNFRDAHKGTRWEDKTPKRVPYYFFSKPGMLDLVSGMRYANGGKWWHVSINVHDAYQRHMNSRVKMTRKNKRTGVMEEYWHELHQDNHLSDCENIVHSRALQIGLIVPPDEREKPE